MTMNELMQKVLEILPDAVFDENEQGEVVISTGVAVLDSNGLLIPSAVNEDGPEPEYGNHGIR